VGGKLIDLSVTKPLIDAPFVNITVNAGKRDSSVELFASLSRNSMAVFLLLSFAKSLGVEVASGD